MEEDREGPKKHPCKDCRFCQWCSDDRCSMCRSTRRCCKKLSIAEQIALYESVQDKGAPEK